MNVKVSCMLTGKNHESEAEKPFVQTFYTHALFFYPILSVRKCKHTRLCTHTLALSLSHTHTRTQRQLFAHLPLSSLWAIHVRGIHCFAEKPDQAFSRGLAGSYTVERKHWDFHGSPYNLKA